MRKIFTVLFCAFIAGVLNINAQDRIISEFRYDSYVSMDEKGTNKQEISAKENGYFLLCFSERENNKVIDIHILEIQNQSLIDSQYLGYIDEITCDKEGAMFILHNGLCTYAFFYDDGAILTPYFDLKTCKLKGHYYFTGNSTANQLYPHKFTALKDRLMGFSWIKKS